MVEQTVSTSFTEENYIKAIYKLSRNATEEVSTTALAEAMHTKPASVSDMLRKLSGKNIINYVKYKGVSLTEEGNRIALQIIRKHRLWEVFLVEKLNFNWDEVHDVAEELEHINSNLLITRLDEFLGHPKFDPHGDPIPSAKGEIAQIRNQRLVAELDINDSGSVIGVKNSQASFLQFLDKVGISLGVNIKVIDKVEFDNSLEIIIDNKKTILISKEVSENILVTD